MGSNPPSPAQLVGLHLGGLCFFDSWFKPAVLSERRTDRNKIIENEKERIIRFEHPQMEVLSHNVIANYKVMHISGKKALKELDESHPMRFFFPLEVRFYLQSCDFELLFMHPFMNEGHSLTENGWNFSVVAKAI